MELREKGTRVILLYLQKVHDKPIYLYWNMRRQGLSIAKSYSIIRIWYGRNNPETSGVECRDNDKHACETICGQYAECILFDENKYSMYMMNLASTIMLFRPEEVEKVRFRHILHCLRVGVGADTDPNR